jgi:hypothetical protein
MSRAVGLGRGPLRARRMARVLDCGPQPRAPEHEDTTGSGNTASTPCLGIRSNGSGRCPMHQWQSSRVPVWQHESRKVMRALRSKDGH